MPHVVIIFKNCKKNKQPPTSGKERNKDLARGNNDLIRTGEFYVLEEEMLLSINLSALKVEGLMTIGPSSRNNNETRNAFKGLRVLKERLNKEIKKEILTELSMGMSGDYELAIAAGSTMVRVGTGIFGKRN